MSPNNAQTESQFGTAYEWSDKDYPSSPVYITPLQVPSVLYISLLSGVPFPKALLANIASSVISNSSMILCEHSQKALQSRVVGTAAINDSYGLKNRNASYLLVRFWE